MWHTSNAAHPGQSPATSASHVRLYFLLKVRHGLNMGNVCNFYCHDLESTAAKAPRSRASVERLDGLQNLVLSFASGCFLARGSPTITQHSTAQHRPSPCRPRFETQPGRRPLPRRIWHYCRRRDFETSHRVCITSFLLFANKLFSFVRLILSCQHPNPPRGTVPPSSAGAKDAAASLS